MTAASLWVFIGCLLLLHMFLIRSPSRQDALRGEEWIKCLLSPPSHVSVLGGFLKKSTPKPKLVNVALQGKFVWDVQTAWVDGKCM